MFAIVKDNKVVQYLQIDTPFILDDVQYPANWLRFAPIYEKNALGIYEVVVSHDPPNFDYRFYWDNGSVDVVNEETKTVNKIILGRPKDLIELRQYWINSIKQTVNSMLQETDWCVVRKAESGVEIPEAIAEYRVAMRQKSNELENQINAITDISELMGVVLNISWPKRKDLPELI